MFLLLLTMAGSQADETDWENMTNKELHDKFQQMKSGRVEDVLNRFEEAMEKIDGMEKTFETKLDNKFNELLARLPPPPPDAPNAPPQQQQQQQQRRFPNQVGQAQRVPIDPGQNSSAAVDASVAPAATGEVEDHHEDEVDQNQNYVQPPTPPSPGHPLAYHRNGTRAPPEVRDHDSS